VCLWQPDDNTKEWLTYAGILARIDKWVADADAGFTDHMGAALDPHLYFDPVYGEYVALDAAALIAGKAQDGQHDLVHFSDPIGRLRHARGGKGGRTRMWGRWFYRDHITTPPRDLAAFEAALTDNQRLRYEKTLTATDGAAQFVLIWPTPHGVVALPLIVIINAAGEREAFAFAPTPASPEERLLRAGPDAPILRTKRVALFGVGALGSRVGLLLAQSGVGFLRVIDGGVLTPVLLTRHAATAVGEAKVDAMKLLLAPFDWCVVDTHPVSPRSPDALADLMRDVDVVIDATGNTLLAELLSRVAQAADVAFITTALYRGGRVARTRRQTDDDKPILDRYGHWRYPTIPAGVDPAADYAGVETGCAAPIHNASPVAVAATAATAAQVAFDHLVGRATNDEEVIDVYEPIDAPFTTRGRYSPSAPALVLTDTARRRIIAAALAAGDNETGGVLVGVYDATGTPCVVDAIELCSSEPSPNRYVLAKDATHAAIDAARLSDARVGYVGEWHTHPQHEPVSATDHATMAELAADRDTGEPVLIVARRRGEACDLDAFVAYYDQLHATALVATGPLPPEEPTA
jgi:hypothetical protein